MIKTKNRPKLVLSRETLRHLSLDNLRQAQGGNVEAEAEAGADSGNGTKFCSVSKTIDIITALFSCYSR